MYNLLHINHNIIIKRGLIQDKKGQFKITDLDVISLYLNQTWHQMIYMVYHIITYKTSHYTCWVCIHSKNLCVVWLRLLWIKRMHECDEEEEYTIYLHSRCTCEKFMSILRSFWVWRERNGKLDKTLFTTNKIFVSSSIKTQCKQQEQEHVWCVRAHFKKEFITASS